MSTEAAAVSTTPNAPAPEAFESGEMTPQERAYFESKGEKTDGLFSGNGTDAKPAPKPANDDGIVDATKSGFDGIDDMIDGEIEVDDQGVPRDKRTGRYVPKSQYLRKYNEAKEASQHLAKTREELVRTRERLAVFAEAFADDGGQKQAQPQQPQEIDPETDIFAAFRQTQAELNALKQKLAEVDQGTRAQIEQRDLQAAINNDLKSFYVKNNDFVDAYNHLLKHRDQEYEALGVEDPGERQTMVLNDAREIMMQAIRNRKSPAERIYQLAKLRGFSGKTQPAISPEAQAKIDRINQGQAASQSLRNAGTAASVDSAMTPARLAQMSDSEYAEARTSYIAKHGRAGWQKLLGM